MRLPGRWIAFCCALVLLPAQAASLSELFAATPPPPADPAAAAAWVRDGKIADPGYLEFRQRLSAEKAAATLATTVPGADSPASADTPAVLGSVAAYREYAAANRGDADPMAAVAKRAVWLTRRFSAMQNRATGSNYQVQVTGELRGYQALFQDWQKQRRSLVERAQAQLDAAGDPAAIRSAANREALAQYRGAMIREIEALLSVTELSVHRAAEAQEGPVSSPPPP